MLVHVDFDDIPDDYRAFRIEIPDDVKIDRLEVSDLPDNWASDLPATQDIGERWVRRASAAAMIVPSVLIEQEYNVIMNPGHSDFSRIKVVAEHDFAFDERIARRHASVR